ncbi:hypothetical protein QN224_07470 [Sinorhizobium sp. 8-89]|nr:hypothetical protein [Sinorhizobium sp. 7-81]MDK1385243.1 hypothetical protein [Sinorhizobium sp. 7-81]
MTFDQILERAKPYAIGFVVGAFAAPIIAFNAGWVTTTSASTLAAETAWIDALTASAQVPQDEWLPPAAWILQL